MNHNSLKNKMKGKIHILPNMFTTANLAMGVYAIMIVLRSAQTGDVAKLKLAAMCIFLGMIFDVFDGFVARLTNTTSHFGMELDSLADMVTFGVAPAIMLYLEIFLSPSAPVFVRKFAIPICMIYSCCAALRLARFNAKIEDEGKTFSGIPTPVAAGVVISYFLLVCDGYLNASVQPLARFIAQWVMPCVTVGLGLLMVATIRFPAPAKQIIWKKHPFVYLVLLVFLLALLINRPGLVLPAMFIGYLCYGLLQALRRSIWKRASQEDGEDEGSDEAAFRAEQPVDQD